MAMWWRQGGFEQGADPLSEDFNFTPEEFMEAGYTHGLQYGEYDDAAYVRCWHHREHLMVEVPWTQFFVKNEMQELFFLTKFAELVRNYLQAEQVAVQRRIAYALENLSEVLPDALDASAQDVCSELGALSTVVDNAVNNLAERLVTGVVVR